MKAFLIVNIIGIHQLIGPEVIKQILPINQIMLLDILTEPLVELLALIGAIYD